MTTTNLATPAEHEPGEQPQRDERPARHRLGDQGKVHVITYTGYQPRPRRQLTRLLRGGAA